jgi:hypothetical protein
VLPLKEMQFNYYREIKHLFKDIGFLFQLAKEGIEKEIYKKLIAPFMQDLPASDVEGFRKVCAEHKYAYVASIFLNKKHSLSVPCKVVPLPGISYSNPLAFIMSKNNTYKNIINWR